MIEEDIGENEFLKDIDHKMTRLSHVSSALKLQKIKLRNKLQLMDEQQKTFFSKDKPNSFDQIVTNSGQNIKNKKSLKLINPCADIKEKSQINSFFSTSKLKATNQQDIQQKRFLQYKKQLSKSINQLKSIYEGQLDGFTNINLDLKKETLNKQELMMYYAKMLPTSSHLPQINQKHTQVSSIIKPKFTKNRSQSEKSLIPVEISAGKQNIKKLSKMNKWYIDPKKRFSIDKEKTLYDWKTQEGLKNVINKSNIKIPGKEINGLVNQVMEKFHRQPLFCKYSKLT